MDQEWRQPQHYRPARLLAVLFFTLCMAFLVMITIGVVMAGPEDSHTGLADWQILALVWLPAVLVLTVVIRCRRGGVSVGPG